MTVLPEPLPPEQRDFTTLISTILDGVVLSALNNYEDEDFAHYVYEAAMTAVYGQDYWIWRNQQKW